MRSLGITKVVQRGLPMVLSLHPHIIYPMMVDLNIIHPMVALQVRKSLIGLKKQPMSFSKISWQGLMNSF